MPLFTKSRNDGIYVQGEAAHGLIMPHIMCTRTESVVYFPLELCVESTMSYIDSHRAKGVRVTLFNIVLAAIARTAYEFPNINRFIAGRRLYLHNSFEAGYVIKRRMSLEGDDSNIKLAFLPTENLFDCAQKMNVRRSEIKRGELDESDELVAIFSHLPRFAMRLAASAVKVLDYFGMLPRAFTDGLPFFASVFISHVGSIGADAPYHHLFEMGTCSIFITLGRVYDKLILTGDGAVRNAKFVNIRATVDERICEGYYLVRALDRFKELVTNPALLEVAYSEKEKALMRQTAP